MTQQVHKFAQMDTPSAVDVPNSWAGLIVWAVGRFGGILIATVILAYAANRLYDDHRKDTERMISAFEKRADVDTKQAAAMQSQVTAMQAQTNAIASLAQTIELMRSTRNTSFKTDH